MSQKRVYPHKLSAHKNLDVSEIARKEMGLKDGDKILVTIERLYG